MDDKKLNEKESLELIAQMIQNTKSGMAENAGVPFLIWGVYHRVDVACRLVSLEINRKL